MTDVEYIHTFTKDEQDRLVRQGELLEPHLHKHIDLSGCSRLLEIGCGVGAQLRLLFRRYPDLHMTGVDISENQIQRARLLLAKELSAGQLELRTCRGDELPFADGSFDAIYICFVLEHVPDPTAVIREAKRVLVDGGRLYCTEVFNDALYVFPPSPAIMRYWRAFNDYQRQIGGDPNIGIRLCNVMIQAGLEVEWLKDASYMLDQRMTDPNERAKYFDHWHANFVSAKQRLLSEGAIDSALVSEFDHEFDRLRHSGESVFLYSNRQVLARRPSPERPGE
ncbi:MAG: methyltransferase domain-containing protein [Planctomycetaceae bacterium]|nr:methyltransferase domain-containing protein [Planctomycetaceae bacterium]